jgi:hypothetical protein
MLGGYASELKSAGELKTKQFLVKVLFSRSNYKAGSGDAIFNTSLDRIKEVTGIRLLEDQECLNELLGRFSYSYELSGETECFARGKRFADSEMEFPHGMYNDFDEHDLQIFERMKERIRSCSGMKDTALIFPMAIKEHIDHFIVREAGIIVAKELMRKSNAAFYFQEDKPYGGIATKEELERIDNFITENKLECRPYRYNPETIIYLAFKHYLSQVEEVYKKGIIDRATFLQKTLNADYSCDRICLFRPDLT